VAWWVKSFIMQLQQEIYFSAVPSNEEITFILEILSDVVSPALDKVEALLPTASSWDGIARNDFCR
jgi:Proteasome-substrate-size regulator, mid region